MDVLRVLPREIVEGNLALVRLAASAKRGTPFRRSHSPGIVAHLESLASEAEVVEETAQFDVSGTEGLREGGAHLVKHKAYERNPAARRLCLQHHGTTCAVCGFDFRSFYGDVAAGYVHVHHIRALSSVGGEYDVNPVEDLRPVCANCHAVIHLGGAVRSIEEVRSLIRRSGEGGT